MGLAGAESGLAQGIQVAGRGAEQGHAGGFGEVEEGAVAGMHRGAVVEKDRRLRRQRRNEPVPHHPAQGRVVEDAVAGPDVAVELVLLEVLKEDAARAVDDAFRHAGGAG